MRKFATIYLNKAMSPFQVGKEITKIIGSFASEDHKLYELVSVSYTSMDEDGVYYATVIVEAGPQLPKVV